MAKTPSKSRSGSAHDPQGAPFGVVIPAFLSLLAPGLGQLVAGRRTRGLLLLATAVAAVGVILWLGAQPGALARGDFPAGAVGVAWLSYLLFAVSAAADALLLWRGREPKTALVVLAAALPFYVAGWVATELAPGRLVTEFHKVRPLVAALFHPDFIARPRPVQAEVKAAILTPCDPAVAASPAPSSSAEGASLQLSADCAALGDVVTISGKGFVPGAQVTLTWLNPLDEALPLGEAVVDAGGSFRQPITVPLRSIPAIYRDKPQAQRVVAAVLGPPGPPQPSETLLVILKNIGVTIALGLLATLLGAIVAVPLAILGARNLMAGSALTRSVYWLVRLTLNVLRAIEPLILCVVFVVWVGQGPFAGMLALTVHSIAALGKLYSEAIEDIDTGPIEAIAATGARWVQMVAYAVLPQMTAPFTAFTVYRWDINVRMSTILGFVGGGGVGFLLQQWINHSDWAEAATAVLVIAVVIMVLDVFSSSVRRRLVAGQALVGARWAWALRLLLVLAVAWSWWLSEVSPRTLASGTGKIGPILGQLLRPEITARGVETDTLTAETVVGCPASPVTAEAARTDESPLTTTGARRLELTHVCASPTETVDVAVTGLPPGATVRLRWLLPDGRRLPGAFVTVGRDGAAHAKLEVRPLILQSAKPAGDRITISAEVTHSVGGLRPSAAFWQVVDRIIATILMALMATTLGAILAAPIGLLAARNIMPPTRIGNVVYRTTRFVLNLVRSVEPIIWASIFASWVGRGTPFAGVLALVVVTVASLGKLFSEAVENIDPGPLEALQAAGANRLQTIAYGVVPQIAPPFLAFTIYHWDINVRISTVVGFVGGGGIGFLLQEWMNTVQWSRASVAIAGIILVVTLMDWASAHVRERFVTGSDRTTPETQAA